MKYKTFLDDIKRTRPALVDPHKRRLHMSERNQPFSDYVFQEFLSTISQSDFLYYNDTRELRDKLAKLHDVSPENIFIGQGSVYVLNCLFNAFIERGTEVVMPEARFPMYDVFLAQNEGVAKNLKYELINNQLKLNTSFEMNENTRMIVIGNPNSPVGDVLSLSQIEELSSHGIPLVVDQAYGEFGKTFIPIEMIEKNVVIVNTFSKGWGAAGARVGYCVANEKIVSLLEKYRQICETPAISQKFAMFLLDNPFIKDEYVSAIMKERNKLAKRFEHVYYGNWVHLPMDKYSQLPEDWEVKANTKLPLVDGEFIRMSIFEGLNDLI